MAGHDRQEHTPANDLTGALVHVQNDSRIPKDVRGSSAVPKPPRRKGKRASWLVLAVIVAVGLAVGMPPSSRRAGTGTAAPLAEADAAYRRGDWERAARLARSRLDTRRGDPEALRLLARASVRLGDTSRATRFTGVSETKPSRARISSCWASSSTASVT